MARERKGSRETNIPSEFDQKIIDLSRVTRVMAGGKRMRFRACVVIGDRKSRVGWAVAKAADVSEAVSKATTKARKNLITVPLHKNTIPHEVIGNYKTSKVLLKPAKEGIGLIAGGSVRSVLELAGVPNIYAKILGRTANSVNNITAVFNGIKMLSATAARQKLVETVIESDDEAVAEVVAKKPTKTPVKRVSKKVTK